MYPGTHSILSNKKIDVQSKFKRLKKYVSKRTMCGVMRFCPQNLSFIKSCKNKMKDSKNHIENKDVKSYHQSDVIM